MIKNKKKKEKSERLEFSKALFIFIAILNFLLLAFCCIMSWKTEDTSLLQIAIAGTAADQAISIKYYYRKSQQENTIKLMEKHKVSPEREDFKNTED